MTWLPFGYPGWNLATAIIIFFYSYKIVGSVTVNNGTSSPERETQSFSSIS